MTSLGVSTAGCDLSSRSIRPRVAAVQDGARGHYGMPIALFRAGILEQMFTDCFIRTGSGSDRLLSLLKRFDLARRANDRRCPELDKAPVIQSLGLVVRARLQRFSHGLGENYFQRIAMLTERWILSRGFGEANALMGFIHNVSPGLCAVARRRGLLVAADQAIAPAAVLSYELGLQAERWAGWEPPEPPERLEARRRFEELTWRELDHITCPSGYVRDGLVQAGVAPDKITVIHYPIDEVSFSFQDRRGRSGPVLVGFVGAVGLRKGAPYFFEVAKRFDPKAVRFVMVGPVQLHKSTVERYAGKVEVIGGVPRSEVAEWLRRFDLVLFPSTCEGSAYALMEAMASGLPLVTSPNSGTVARHGQEGFVVPYDDVEALSESVRELVENPARRLEMGCAARRRYEECNLDSYSRGLSRTFQSLLGAGQPLGCEPAPSASRPN